MSLVLLLLVPAALALGYALGRRRAARALAVRLDADELRRALIAAFHHAGALAIDNYIDLHDGGEPLRIVSHTRRLH